MEAIERNEDEELREILDDLIDEAIVRERIRNIDFDDDSNFITMEELDKEFGFTREEIESVGDVRIE